MGGQLGIDQIRFLGAREGPQGGQDLVVEYGWLAPLDSMLGAILVGACHLTARGHELLTV